MKKKDISAVIMLLAGVVAIISCIYNQYSLIDTLKVVLIVLVLFYAIGLILAKIVEKVNTDAEAAYINAEREKMKEQPNEEEEEQEIEEEKDQE